MNEQRSTRPILVFASGAAALFAAAILGAAPCAADIGSAVVTPQDAGSANPSAARDFTVNLKKGSTLADASVVARYFRGFGLRVRIDADDGILFASGTVGQTGSAAHSSYRMARSGGIVSPARSP